MTLNLAIQVSDARVYEVTCEHVEFAGLVTFIAYSWPFLTVWISFSYLILPVIYKCSAKCSRVMSVFTEKVDTDHLEAKQLGYVANIPPDLSSARFETSDDRGEEIDVGNSIPGDVDRDFYRCTHEHSAKPFAQDGTATSDSDAARELFFVELMDLFHCLVDVAVSKHVERIRSEMSTAIPEPGMPASDVHLDGCLHTAREEGVATQYGSLECDAAANGGRCVEHNDASIVDDLQERLAAIAALSPRLTSEAKSVCLDARNVANVGEWTCGDASQRYSLLRGPVSDKMLTGEASTRSAFMQFFSELEKRLATLARIVAVDAVMHLDEFPKDKPSQEAVTKVAL